MKKSGVQKTQIPNDFDLSKYKNCEKWTVVEWAAALRARMLLRFNWNLACQDGKSENTPAHLIEEAKKRAKRFYTDPCKIENKLLKQNLKAIRDLNVADVLSNNFTFNQAELAEWVDKYKFTMDFTFYNEDDEVDLAQNKHEKIALEYNKELTETPAWRIFREENPHSTEFFISVNLGEANDRIIAEFKSWLKRTRQAAGIHEIRRTYTKFDFWDWCDSKLLPYLDLNFWAITHGQKLTLSQLSTALKIKPPRNSESTSGDPQQMARTIKSKAEIIISEEVVEALARQAISHLESKQKADNAVCGTNDIYRTVNCEDSN